MNAQVVRIDVALQMLPVALDNREIVRLHPLRPRIPDLVSVLVAVGGGLQTVGRSRLFQGPPVMYASVGAPFLVQRIWSSSTCVAKAAMHTAEIATKTLTAIFKDIPPGRTKLVGNLSFAGERCHSTCEP